VSTARVGLTAPLGLVSPEDAAPLNCAGEVRIQAHQLPKIFSERISRCGWTVRSPSSDGDGGRRQYTHPKDATSSPFERSLMDSLDMLNDWARSWLAHRMFAGRDRHATASFVCSPLMRPFGVAVRAYSANWRKEPFFPAPLRTRTSMAVVLLLIATQMMSRNAGEYGGRAQVK
jgi:hypothetical protein